MRARAWLPLALSAAAACGGEGDLTPRRQPLSVGPIGASIAVLDDGMVAVVDPDQGSVSIVDGRSLQTVRRVDVGAEPRALLALSRTSLLVLNYRSGDLVRIDPTSGVVTGRVAVCAGPRGFAASEGRSDVAVTCESDGAVMKVDARTLVVTRWLDGLRRPRAVALVDGALVVADHVGGVVRVHRGTGPAAAVSLVPTTARDRPALTAMTANLATSFAACRSRLCVSHLLLNHTGVQAGEEVADDYGSVVDGHPKINPAVTALEVGTALTQSAVPPTYARYDGTLPIFNGPSSIASWGDRYVLVAHESSANVAVVDVDQPSSSTRVVAAYAVGAGPSGIAVDEANGVAYVDNAFDGSVSRIDLRAPRATPPPLHEATTQVRTLPQPHSALARAGRKLFFDATNRHLTKAGVVACSTCHPAGGDDGLIWFAHTPRIPLKRRRTPHLANARSSSAPFHWDGSLATMEDLVGATVTDLMAGDGVLVDGAAVQAFIDEIVQPPPTPAVDAALAAEGASLFTSRGCGTCHAGADGTDHLRHAVLAPVSTTADDVISEVDTPGLRGVATRAPFFHDGRSPSLRDLLSRADAAKHTGAPPLSSREIDALSAYLTTR